jgi:hypothetical protein
MPTRRSWCGSSTSSPGPPLPGSWPKLGPIVGAARRSGSFKTWRRRLLACVGDGSTHADDGHNKEERSPQPLTCSTWCSVGPRPSRATTLRRWKGCWRRLHGRRDYGTAAVVVGVLDQATSLQGRDNSGRFRLTLVAARPTGPWIRGSCQARASRPSPDRCGRSSPGYRFASTGGPGRTRAGGQDGTTDRPQRRDRQRRVRGAGPRQVAGPGRRQRRRLAGAVRAGRRDGPGPQDLPGPGRRVLVLGEPLAVAERAADL